MLIKIISFDDLQLLTNLRFKYVEIDLKKLRLDDYQGIMNDQCCVEDSQGGF